MIMTITALPGIDIRQIGKSLAIDANLRYVASDEITRKASKEPAGKNGIDKFIYDAAGIERTKHAIESEAKGKDCIIEHPIAAWILKEADAKVFLQSFRRNRARMLAKREKIPVGEALERIESEEAMLSRIMMDGFSIDLSDLGVYDLVLNIDRLSSEGVIEVMRKYIEQVEK